MPQNTIANLTCKFKLWLCFGGQNKLSQPLLTQLGTVESLIVNHLFSNERGSLTGLECGEKVCQFLTHVDILDLDLVRVAPLDFALFDD